MAKKIPNAVWNREFREGGWVHVSSEAFGCATDEQGGCISRIPRDQWCAGCVEWDRVDTAHWDIVKAMLANA